MEVTTKTISLYLTLHGKFKQYQPKPIVHLTMPEGCTIENVRHALSDYLLAGLAPEQGIDVQSLIANCHFAERGDLLADAYELTKETQLGVIPPL